MNSATYQPLRSGRLRLAGRNLWQSTDHLLLIKTRAFREIYSRIYWADIETTLLYPLSRPQGPLLIFEIFCVLAAAVSAPFTGVFRGSILAVLFIFFYAVWRLTCANWACQLTTRISKYRFPLTFSQASSRRVVDEINTRVLSAQAPLPPEAVISTARFGDKQDAPEPERAKLVMHAVAFGLGLLAPLNDVIVVLYYLALIPLFFIRRNFEFPFAVRAAAVMSQILAVLDLLHWLIDLRFPLVAIRHSQYELRMPWEFHILRALFSLFGMIAIHQHSVERSRYRPKASTALGLG